MKRGIRTAFLLWAMVLSTGSAMADHTLPHGSIDRLRGDTKDLFYAVRYSYLAYQVKQAVSRFAYDVETLGHCLHGYPQNRDHDLIPGACEHYLDEIHYSYYPVQRYLYDTYYDYPQVYSRWVRVDHDMRTLPH